VIAFCHAAATNYAGLIPLRFFLGFADSALLPAMETTMGMFFTPHELHHVQPMLWISCVGSSIPAAFLRSTFQQIHRKPIEILHDH
jgi:hypothetical protein